MLKHYVSLAAKVLLRRKFFTFISLFGISFTLLVLMVITAMFDHAFAKMPPETRQDLTLGLAGIDDVEVLSGLAEGDEIIISDMRDYAHLSEVALK
jgi:hypothetical protein